MGLDGVRDGKGRKRGCTMTKRARVYDILVDFQTGGNFPVLVEYIYKFCN